MSFGRLILSAVAFGTAVLFSLVVLAAHSAGQSDNHPPRVTVVCVDDTQGRTSDCGYSDNDTNGDQ